MTLNLHARLLRAVAAGTFAAVAPLAAQAAVTISAGATSNINCTNGVCTPAHKNAVLNVTQLDGMLASGNVKITTGGSRSSDIVVSAAIGWASASTLTLDAYQSITIDKSISVNGSGGLAILTNDGGTGGDYSFGRKGNVTFLGTTNPLTINGNSYTLVDNIATLAADIAAQPAGFYALASSYDASADGTYSTSPVPTTLSGAFEGLGHTISKLTIVNTEDSGQDLALFTKLTGTIRDVGLLNADVSGNSAEAFVAPLVVTGGGVISRSYATGKVSGEFAGGLVCTGSATIVDSYASTRVVGTYAAGGLIAANGGTISQSFATGEVTGKVYIGGLVGYNGGMIENAYATGATAGGSKQTIGGLIGINDGEVAQAYSTGQVIGQGRSAIGGLIGDDETPPGALSDTYWDTNTSGITNASQGAGNISNDPGITGLTTAQLQSGLPAGFDPSIWAENANVNSGLPYLLAVPPS